MQTRSRLDQLNAQARAAIVARDAIDDLFSFEWRDAHAIAHELCLARDAERSRLFRAEPWGAWMSQNDRECAHITGSL